MSPTPPSSNQRSIRLSLALYRTLFMAYPAAFRRAYGAQMLQVFRDRCRQATQARGLRGLLALWVPTLADLFRTALAERLATTRLRSRPFLSRLCGLLLLVSVSLPLLFVLVDVVRALFGISHLHQLAPGLMSLADGGVAVVSAVVLPLYPVWGLLGLLLYQRTRLGWLGGGLALLGQLLFLWNVPLSTWTFPLDASGGTVSLTLTPSLLGLVVVMPLGLLLCGLVVWRERVLGHWSVVVVLLFLATGLQGLLILVEWVSVFLAAPSFDVGFFPMGFLQYGVVPLLWAGVGYALWVRQTTSVAGSEPLAPSTLP